jgi:hypothetical protein
MLREALMNGGDAKLYLNEREKLKSVLNERDYRYLSFQLWQEGISRYTEYKIAARAGQHYEPTASFKSLNEFEGFKTVAEGILSASILAPLQKFDLARDKWEAFYSYGAAEGLLLDRINPKWRDEYFKKKFYLEEYFN